MRFTAQILSAALLAGMAAAQSAPASQNVQPEQSKPSKVQSEMNKVKSVLKNPFKPKTGQPAQAPAKPAAAAVKPQAQAPVAKQPAPVAAQKKQPAPITAQKVKPASATAQKAKQPAPVTAQKTKQPASVAARKAAPASLKREQPVKHAAPVVAKAAKPAKPAPKAKKAAPVVAKVTPKPQAKPVTPAKPAEPAPAVAESAKPKLPNPGKRDPFLSPIAAAAMRGPAAGCSTGKHCLVVDQIALKGIVQTNEGNIAMVENAAKRSYYLHENDALFDGSVVKITGDSVTFRQESTDILGRPVSKEVVKKVSAPAV